MNATAKTKTTRKKTKRGKKTRKTALAAKTTTGAKRGVKKGSKRKPAAKLAGQLVNFKVTKTEKALIIRRATRWTKGNISRFIRHQVLESPVKAL